MNNILLLCTVSLIVFGLYKVILSIYFFQQSFKLKGKPLDIYIKHLGRNYMYKEYGNGITRYKWKKGWITMKADFDKTGIAYNEKAMFAYFKPNLDY